MPRLSNPKTFIPPQDAADQMTKAMWGCYSMHVPLNLIIQDVDQGSDRQMVTVFGQSCVSRPGRRHPLMFGSEAVHQLILGDAVIRPHIVIETNAFAGYGLSGLMTMSPGDWLNAEHRVLLNQTDDLSRRLIER